MNCPRFWEFSRCKVVMNSKCGKKNPKTVTLVQYSFVFKAKQNRNGERNIQTNVSVKYLLNSCTMSVRTIAITTCQFHRGIMAISRLRSVSPSLLSCSNQLLPCFKTEQSTVRASLFVKWQVKICWTWHYRMEQMPVFSINFSSLASGWNLCEARYLQMEGFNFSCSSPCVGLVPSAFFTLISRFPLLARKTYKNGACFTG